MVEFHGEGSVGTADMSRRELLVGVIMLINARRIVCVFVISLVPVCAVFSGGGGERSGVTGDPVTIRWHGSRGMPGEQATIPPLLEELVSEKVGFPVTFELTGTDEGNHHPQLERMLAAGNLPDCFLYMGLDEEFLSQAAAKFELPDMFTHMPRMTKYLRELMSQLDLNETATWSIYIDDADGKMWGVPRTWEYGWVPSGQMWRKDILEEMGYEIPTTLSEAEEVFSSYKAYYPDRYAMGGSGAEPTWQCFDIVYNAFGIVAGGHHVRYDTIVQSFATPQFREALSVLRRWYRAGFIDPDFMNDKNLEKFRKFGRGEYLVTEWMSRGSWTLDESGRNKGYAAGLRGVRDALAVPATHLAADEHTMPVQRVWSPFLTQVSAFGKHLEDNPEKIHKIMQVADVIAHDREAKLLSNYGVEGEHYRWDQDEERPIPLPTGSRSPIRDFGYGYYWAGTFSTYSILGIEDRRVIDEYVNDPNGIYGSNNLDLWFPIIKGPVEYENGEPVEVDMETEWFEMSVRIITGERPLEYYDEWLARYYERGGRDWEEHATRLWLD